MFVPSNFTTLIFIGCQFTDFIVDLLSLTIFSTDSSIQYRNRLVKTNPKLKDQIFTSQWTCRQSPSWLAPPERKTPHLSRVGKLQEWNSLLARYWNLPRKELVYDAWSGSEEACIAVWNHDPFWSTSCTPEQEDTSNYPNGAIYFWVTSLQSCLMYVMSCAGTRWWHTTQMMAHNLILKKRGLVRDGKPAMAQSNGRPILHNGPIWLRMEVRK